MTKIVIVSVNWLNGKAIHLPSGSKYLTVAKFKDGTHWEKEAYSRKHHV